ncbi:MAG TPA: alpha/beta hydrolase [Ktedonobacterales bacterium]|jgi:pimeloyl-ACP methyl ester carboxylesterase
MECFVRSIPVHYEERGEGRPILMLHGMPTDHRQIMYEMEPLFAQRSGWRRLYLDLPGMGQTPGADSISSQDDMLEVALAFLDALALGERFVVAGLSYGGYLARGVVYRRRTQLDGVLLGAPAVHPNRATRRLPPHQVLVQDPTMVAALMPDEQLVTQVAVVQSPEYLDHFRAAIKPGILVADNSFLERFDAQPAFSFPMDDLPEPCPAPTLIVTGRQDSICGYQDAMDLLESFTRGTLVVLDRAGHGLATEQKALYDVLVGEWLDRVEEYASLVRAAQ